MSIQLVLFQQVSAGEVREQDTWYAPAGACASSRVVHNLLLLIELHQPEATEHEDRLNLKGQ